jgi:hypothetical protein
LLSDLYGTSTNFFTNDDAIEKAYNVTPIPGATANTIVPYEYSNTSNVSITYSPEVPCFLEGSEILTLRGYVKVEELKNRDFVMTYKSGFKRIYKLGKDDMLNVGIDERIKDQLYVCKKEKFKELKKDLIMTGGHSILVNSFQEVCQIEKMDELYYGVKSIHDKYLLLSCLDERAEVYKEKGKYSIYHIALENEDEDSNYGIYANGLLVESCSKHNINYFKWVKNFK